MDTVNFVAKLNEYAQKTGSELRYEDVCSTGRDHNKTWVEQGCTAFYVGLLLF